jgi:pyridoxal phosphate-dependent aminotransferase EpsN
MEDRIQLAAPNINGNEMKYINEAFSTNWIGPLGENVEKFEDEMRVYLGAKHTTALSCGTAALHMAVKYCDVKPGDTVFCSDVTFVGSCNPIMYEKAKPVFIDADRESYNMSPRALERALHDAKKSGKLPKAVIIVDLYGLPANYDKIMPICEEYAVPVIEDAAEALGSKYQNTPCGKFGDIGILSFNSNKIITSSTGGMLIAKSNEVTSKVKFWATQAREKAYHYEHKEVGHNYRMSNICAGIGRGQLETLDQYVQKKKEINKLYREELANLPIVFEPIINGADPNFWLTVIQIQKSAKLDYIKLLEFLEEYNIEARPFWKPMHMQELFRDSEFYSDQEGDIVGEELFSKGLCIPSSTTMTQIEQERVIGTIKKAFK